MTAGPIALSADDRRLVVAILRAVLPAGARVWVFGSRASGEARRFSDLDLAIDCGRPLTLDESARLAEAFSDSDLAYKVDCLDWHGADAGFRAAIGDDRVPLIDIGPGAPEE